MALRLPLIGEREKPRVTPVPLFSFVPDNGGPETQRRDISEKVYQYWKQARTEVDPEHLRLPRLVVRDHRGVKLDIYTSFQDAIYAAKRNVRATGEAKTAEEWRLPKGPLPSKPDYSRKGPPVIPKNIEKQNVVKEIPAFRQQPFTVDVDDVSFVKESLRCLPDIASLSYLRHEFLSGRKIFLPILQGSVLHERLLSALDKREQAYTFPGFCTGCIRSGLCYGCNKASQPHYHMDKMAKTGGGFTYYKRDRPGYENQGNNPRYWKSQLTQGSDQQNQGDEGSSERDQGSSSADMVNSVRVDAPPHKNGLIPDFSLQFATAGQDTSDLGLGTDEEQGIAGDSDGLRTDRDSFIELGIHGNGAEVSRKDLDQLRSHVSAFKNTPSTTRDSGMDDESVSVRFNDVGDIQDDGWPDKLGNHGKMSEGRGADADGTGHGQDLFLAGNGSGSNQVDVHLPKMGTTSTELTDELRGNEGDVSGEEMSDTEEPVTRERLYKVPPPFKVKPREQKTIKSETPFSTNRKFNLPKGKGLDIKKSDKDTTKFVEFDQAREGWKEPKQFELEKGEKKSTSFWTPTAKKDAAKPERKPRAQPERRPKAKPERSVSPDSGMESEQLTAWLKQIIRRAEVECHNETRGTSVPDSQGITGWVEYPAMWLNTQQNQLAEKDDMTRENDNYLKFSEISAIGGYVTPNDEGEIENSIIMCNVDRTFSIISSMSGYTPPTELSPKNSGSQGSSEGSSSCPPMSYDGTPPQHESPQVPLTSPEFNMSLGDIDETIIPCSFNFDEHPGDAFNADSGMKEKSASKKHRHRRRKRSKKQGSEHDQDGMEAEIGENGDEERLSGEATGGLTAHEPYLQEFSPFFRSSEKYKKSHKKKHKHSKKESHLTPEFRAEGTESVLLPWHDDDGKKCDEGGSETMAIRSNPVETIDGENYDNGNALVNVCQEDFANVGNPFDDVGSHENSDEDDLSYFETESKSSCKSYDRRLSGSSSKSNDGRHSRRSTSQSCPTDRLKTADSGISKAGEKKRRAQIFCEIDEKLLKQLPSIREQLRKLGINIDTLNLGAKFGPADSKLDINVKIQNLDRPNTPTVDYLNSNLKTYTLGTLNVQGRPLSALSETTSELTVPVSAQTAQTTRKSLTTLHLLGNSAQSCSACGASLDNIAGHICLPPISNRMKPKKMKMQLPRRVVHPRRQNGQILVQEVDPREGSSPQPIVHADTPELPDTEPAIDTDPPKVPSTSPQPESTKESTPVPPKSAPSEKSLPPVSGKSKQEAPVKKQKKEVVRKVRPPSPPPVRPPPPSAVIHGNVPEPPRQELSSPKSLTPTPSPTPELSPQPSLDPPELPDFVFPDRDSSGKKIKKANRTMIAASPTLVVGKESKKQRKAPPKIRKPIKVKQPKRPAASAVAEAPVTREELQQVIDPLDFLAKYCIIHAERLPFYQRIFSKTTMEQSSKYPRPSTALLSDQLDRGNHFNNNNAVSKSYNGSESLIDFDGNDDLRNPNLDANFTPQFSSHEMKMLQDMTVLNRLPRVQTVVSNPGEQYLEKLDYSLELLMEKQKSLQSLLLQLEAKRLQMIAAEAKELFPDIMSNDSKKKKKSGKKAGKKSAVSSKSGDAVVSQRSTPVDRKMSTGPTPTPRLNSDEAVVERLSDKMLDMVCATPEITRVELQLERADEKLNDTACRIEELEAERTIIQMYCMENFFQDQMGNGRSTDFMRQQSGLYDKLHPSPDLEMNMSEVGAALQAINNHLLTEKEMEYLFRVLNLAGRPRINFQLFSVLAALSERVAQLDPLIKKLINKLNYEALDVKMERCKELFALLLDGEYLRDGGALASTLAVELTAGGLTPQHTAYVLSKFNRDGSGVIDFMDFVTYVPLFIEIHHRIVDDPLRVDLDL